MSRFDSQSKKRSSPSNFSATQRLTRWLGSLQLAIASLALLASVLVLGTVVESWYDSQIAEQLVYDVKYEGYVARQEIDVARQRRLSEKRIPDNFDYHRLVHLRTEAREKLSRIRPMNLAQASRISGITPADVALVLVHLEGRR